MELRLAVVPFQNEKYVKYKGAKLLPNEFEDSSYPSPLKISITTCLKVLDS